MIAIDEMAFPDDSYFEVSTMLPFWKYVKVKPYPRFRVIPSDMINGSPKDLGIV